MSEERRGEGSEHSATGRADELLNRLGQSAGVYGSLVSRRFSRVASFVREEAEDMWAEAKSIRQQRLQTEDSAETAATTDGADASEREAQEEYVTESGAEESVSQGEDTTEATPAARHHAEEVGVDLQEVEGTGAGGHITLEDVEKKAESEG